MAEISRHTYKLNEAVGRYSIRNLELNFRQKGSYNEGISYRSMDLTVEPYGIFP
jgi:hypothetical protein